MNLELIGVKLENILYEAEFIPHQHIKNPKKSGSGKIFIGKNPRWPPKHAESQSNAVLINRPSSPTTQFSYKCVKYH